MKGFTLHDVDLTRRSILCTAISASSFMLLGGGSALSAFAAADSAADEASLIASTKLTLAQANRVLAHEDFVDALGHISARHPTKPDRYFLSRSKSPALVSRNDLVEFHLDNTPVEPTTVPIYIERPIHGQFYEARPDVNSVIHSHCHDILPFTIIDRPLVPVIASAALMGSTVPMWDIRAKFGDSTDNMVSSVDRGRDLAKATGENNVVLIRSHGCAVVGSDIIEAVARAILVALNARVELAAMPYGTPRQLTAGEIAALLVEMKPAKARARSWEYWLARANLDRI